MVRLERTEPRASRSRGPVRKRGLPGAHPWAAGNLLASWILLPFGEIGGVGRTPTGAHGRRESRLGRRPDRKKGSLLSAPAPARRPQTPRRTRSSRRRARPRDFTTHWSE